MHEQDGDTEPAHHARRPMNAFLIFCKRHRSVVRDKYPNLENRSITKILGEWWANLDKEEKAGYTGLAKQYKDAFFSANPDFKWYKLPAPPLRTLSARPRESEKHTEVEDHEERTNNNSTRVDLNIRSDDDSNEPQPRSLSMFTPGKLADEAQMGGISSLLATDANYHPRSIYRSPDRPKNDTIRELQNALSETSKLFEEDFEGPYRYNVPGELTNQDVIDQIVDKRYSAEELSDDERKSGRSCKGKRYQEFMAVGLLVKRRRDDPEDDYAACSWEPSSSQPLPKYESDSTAAEPDSNPTKTFKAADFDLDAKIRALPSLSLEKFQQRKRENKRKKKSLTLKPKYPQIVNSVPRSVADERQDPWRETVSGSQKRKPRKKSITRLEINSLITRVENGGNKISPEIKLATEATEDLFALATLAEVAANTSKLDSTGASQV
ncbi:uncharacterized protein LOC121734593 [Aricia agestis]|uniref:uncharacterized protein LOC121734593 n=1 Tax=Aricia agestis TaxID=91739 RepID=UPI001C20524D|nr:uncharacterized protein LOC121734593 [Aricia agestis]